MSDSRILKHWEYFLSLEKDLINLRGFIEIHPDNYKTYSLELSKILQLACAEIDSVCRLLCKEIDSSSVFHDSDDKDSKKGNIAEYKRIFLNKYPKIGESEVCIPGLEDPIKPWIDWKTQYSPSWWRDHNKVKHYRHDCFKFANLENTLFSMSALMIMIMYYDRQVNTRSYGAPCGIDPNFFTSPYFGFTMTSPPNANLPDFDPS